MRSSVLKISSLLSRAALRPRWHPTFAQLRYSSRSTDTAGESAQDRKAEISENPSNNEKPPPEKTSHTGAEFLDFDNDVIPETNQIQDPFDIPCPPLPELPPAPDYPCSYLTQADINTYLLPLYHRAWVVGSSEYSREVSGPPSLNASPELAKQFWFQQGNHEAALTFRREIQEIQNDELHHCVTITSECMIHIRTHTHSARPLPTSPGRQPPVRPGITLRDVRLAMLIERAFERHLARGVASAWSQNMQRAATRPLTEDDIEQRRLLHILTRNRPRCPICHKTTHVGRDCPDQRKKIPMTPCQHCGRMHWTWTCPTLTARSSAAAFVADSK